MYLPRVIHYTGNRFVCYHMGQPPVGYRIDLTCLTGLLFCLGLTTQVEQGCGLLDHFAQMGSPAPQSITYSSAD